MTNIECHDCLGAASGQWHGFLDSCDNCTARAVSRSQLFFDVRSLGILTAEYLDMLRTLRVTHEQVKAAKEADRI